MPNTLKDKIALVTGAATGIGRASAQTFAREGARVVISDINDEEARKTVSLIQEAGGDAVYIRADVSREDQVKSLIEKIVELYGRIDCAHNNAGIRGARAEFVKFSEEVWDQTISINLKGVWLCMKHELLHMLNQKSGAIVNTSSIAGLVGLPHFSPYAASKHGIIGLTKTAAIEYIRSGIRINAVCPGMIDTPILERTVAGKARPDDPIREMFRQAKKAVGYQVLSMQQTAGRIGDAEEVAEAVVWLCSDAASFVNGHALVIDGGYTVR